jgi:TolB protein
MNFNANKKFLAFFLFICFLSKNTEALLSVDIDSGNIQPINVAVLGLNDRSLAEENMNIESVIQNDLDNSSLFKVHYENFDNLTLDSFPSFSTWIKKDTNFLLVGKITRRGKDIQIKYRIWNAFNKKQVAGKIIEIDQSKWRQLAHIVADDVYEAATNDPGYFNTRILYVAESGPFDRRVKRLAIMDYDGENHGYLTSEKHMILSPRISSDGKKILYMSFADKIPRVHLYDMETNSHRPLGDFDGMTSAPRFGFNIDIALLAMSKNGATNVYKFDIHSFAKKQLTNNEFINTSPSYSPDNQFIIFNSDRSRSPQLYVMRNDGSDQKRISFGPGRYLNPVWSPNGDYIAFVKILNGVFYIGIMRPNGDEEKILASGHMIESPSWSPNGRLLIFSSTTRGGANGSKKSRLYMVDITGRHHKLVKTHGDATDPMWSSNVKFG